MQRANGWMSFHMFSRHIGIPLVGQRGRPIFNDLGVEAVIPLKTRFPMLRTSLFALDSNDSLLEKSLGLVDERRENDMVQLAYYHQKLKQGHDSSVKLRPLAPRDLVLRKVVDTIK